MAAVRATQALRSASKAVPVLDVAPAGPLGVLAQRGLIAAVTHGAADVNRVLAARFPDWWHASGYDTGSGGGGNTLDGSGSGNSGGWDRRRQQCDAAGLRADQVPAVYVGFDPTADSLHVGNLLQVCALRALQASGFRPIVLIGGATGMIGDPSGRSTERVLMDDAALAANIDGIRRSLLGVVDCCDVGDVAESDASPTAARLVDNAEFYRDMSAIEFVRDVGRHFRVSAMLGKDSVRSRMDSGAGLSFTEFSYQLFQAHDFLHLYQRHSCVMQLGGGDQWGNITAGTDLIRRAVGAEAVGVTIPLLTTPSGEKYGKSAGNAVWLNEDRTSHYTLYQHFLHTPDAQVGSLLRLFTTLDLPEIESVMQRHVENPGQRTAQRVLAQHVTTDVRGEQALSSAEQASRILFGGSLEGVSANDLIAVAQDVPSVTLPHAEVVGRSIIDVAVAAKAVASKGEARRLVKAGGLYLNNKRVGSAGDVVVPEALLEQRVALLRTGKRKTTLLRVRDV